MSTVLETKSSSSTLVDPTPSHGPYPAPLYPPVQTPQDDPTITHTHANPEPSAPSPTGPQPNGTTPSTTGTPNTAQPQDDDPIITHTHLPSPSPVVNGLLTSTPLPTFSSSPQDDDPIVGHTHGPIDLTATSTNGVLLASAQETISLLAASTPSQYSASPQTSPFVDPHPVPSQVDSTQKNGLHVSAPAPEIHVAQEQWNQIMSASLSALANQFQAASRALHRSHSQATLGSRHPHDEGSVSYTASVSVDHEGTEDAISELLLPRSASGSGEVGVQGIETMLSLMMSRLENVERNQVQFGKELDGIKEELKDLKEEKYRVPHYNEKEKMKENDAQAEVNGVAKGVDEEWQKRVEDLEKKLESVQETIKIDQARLYPRLHNAFVALNKHEISPLPIQGTGKAPANFPVTKGEFEHLTKERYEQMLKAYGLPIKGDTAAKREAVRQFIGLTQPGK